jgi:hypothetical protein
MRNPEFDSQVTEITGAHWNCSRDLEQRKWLTEGAGPQTKGEKDESRKISL